MKLNIGDHVRFLDRTGGGKVVDIIDNKTVMVLIDEEGFELPFLARDLVVVNTESKDDFFKAKEKTQEAPQQDPIKSFLNEETITKDNEEVNIYLAFLPQDPTRPTSSRQILHLVNDSNWHLMYVWQVRKNKRFESHPGMLQPNYIETLKTFDLQEINEIKEIVVQIIFFRKIPYEIKLPAYTHIRINPKLFYDVKSFKINDFFEQKALIFPVIEENPLVEAVEKLKKDDFKKVVFEKEVKNKKINQPKKFKDVVKQDLREVDLHINELLENTTGMDAKAMLDYQMDVFKRELQKAQKEHHIKKIVFIHGKGNGRLRTEIRTYLELNKIKYQDASFQKYGFGATLVFV